MVFTHTDRSNPAVRLLQSVHVPHKRLPLVMYYFDGFKIREIADILEMSESAIKMRLNRGKIQLRTMFEKEAAI